MTAAFSVFRHGRSESDEKQNVLFDLLICDKVRRPGPPEEKAVDIDNSRILISRS